MLQMPIANKAQADLLIELLDKAVTGANNARALADLYDAAKLIQSQFAAPG